MFDRFSFFFSIFFIRKFFCCFYDLCSIGWAMPQPLTIIAAAIFWLAFIACETTSESRAQHIQYTIRKTHKHRAPNQFVHYHFIQLKNVYPKRKSERKKSIVASLFFAHKHIHTRMILVSMIRMRIVQKSVEWNDLSWRWWSGNRQRNIFGLVMFLFHSIHSVHSS